MSFPADLECHGCSKQCLVSVQPISEEEKLINPSLTIHFNVNTQQRFWYIRPDDLELVNVGNIWDGSTKSAQIIIPHSNINLDHAISPVFMLYFKDEFKDQYDAIIETTTHRLQNIMTKEISKVCVDLTLRIDHICDGRILVASSEDGMVPASKSSIEYLEPMEAHERNSKDECVVCLDELGEETQVLSMPCSHMFHAQCITKWLQKSHYCPICRFEMPTE